MILKPLFDDNSNTPLAEYPRPQFKRDSYLSLNGQFDYDITKNDEKPSFIRKILVPYSPESELSGVNHILQNDEVLWYRRVFSLDPSFVKEKVFLNIGACDQISEVYLNGSFVGKHMGGYNSFSFEISSYLKEENELTIKNIRTEEYNPTTSYSGTKNWVDPNNATRPNSLHLTLMIDDGDGNRENDKEATYKDSTG